ncbi:tumor protein p73-like isoform X1 [Schistocerca gregaria]|uniref:tumor protein p73-like isoform X1 n=1 Tax=Schistocerca gregaria TaxID=7010 RepID=UPI00211E8043|nr:tumor protein p73-like isoform X1 [Schistocerca gregaria]
MSEAPVMELGENLYEGCDQLSVSEQEVSSSQSLSEMLVSSRTEYCLEDAYTTEESLTWPTAMGLGPLSVTSTTTTATTNAASASFPATVKRPHIDAFAGQYDFDIQPSRHQEDAHWVYSQILDKVFTDIGKSVRFNVTLSTDWTPSTALFIRALPLFVPESESFEEVVKTCPTHEDLAHTLNAGCPSVKHVVRCSDPLTQYQTDPVSGRYSVVTPLCAPQPGATSIPLLYTFVCKNSCRGGIGRRALALAFTLEDVSGEILGRRVLEVRVCSCPRRDKEKQEKQYLRNHSRDQSEEVQSETKTAIQQLMHVSRIQALQEVPQTQVAAEQQRDSPQECDNTALRASSHIIGMQRQQAEQPCIYLPVYLSHQREIKRQAIAMLWRDAGENQVPFSECDSILRQVYKEDY